ncbi:unnamed protein product [Hermetia illucens]|uniref:Uncharacterized protein n=1 Tax=Hermetia illucens TaxID=343691 RepID=A0A7R8UQZ3_HERIL|nr:unnamed protein product [Hermetia illucens]
MIITLEVHRRESPILDDFEGFGDDVEYLSDDNLQISSNDDDVTFSLIAGSKNSSITTSNFQSRLSFGLNGIGLLRESDATQHDKLPSTSWYTQVTTRSSRGWYYDQPPPKNIG